MKNRKPFAVASHPSATSTPSALLSELDSMLAARPKLAEEKEKIDDRELAHKLLWTKDLARESAANVNAQSLVSRFRDLQTKEQDFNNQRNSVDRALQEIDDAVDHYEREHRQDLIQAIQVRLDHMSDTCKEYEELKKRRDALMKKPDGPARRQKRGAGGKAHGDD
jgi:hypothetical protein